MKLTFLPQLFVLGFFSKVALTSPLVARQNSLPVCDSETPLLCSITIRPDYLPPNIPFEQDIQCADSPSAECTKHGMSVTKCHNINLISSPQCNLANGRFKGIFNCTYDDQSESECGFFCHNCQYYFENGSLICADGCVPFNS
ncbi:16682_t:CDS:1 [Cetraspora pellucida]|uniref:16682_t:CDS:1 n=1 Tax=Cetraspora pellucida TaxID=1433469 RepID=A0ACA9LS53_9GLOM|nr:16682_t:CDS:1 [Cetraspora pellucida]